VLQQGGDAGGNRQVAIDHARAWQVTHLLHRAREMRELQNIRMIVSYGIGMVPRWNIARSHRSTAARSGGGARFNPRSYYRSPYHVFFITHSE
jgi:hypothetical protein